MGKEKKVNSFSELNKILTFEDSVRVEVKEKKIKKEKPLYDGSDIRIKGTQLMTKDQMYETFSVGSYTSWRRTIIGQKNGAADIGNDIENGYNHSSFHDRDRAAEILVQFINCK